MEIPSNTGPRTHNRCLSSGQASLRLRFILVGGNIGGLACAYALASTGHDVRVLERLQTDDQTSWSGIRVPPNLSKILTEWGLGAELKEKTHPCRRVTFDDLETGHGIGCVEWREEFIQETGGDFLLMHHRDLYNMLYRIANEAGAEIIHGAEVLDIKPGSPKRDDAGTPIKFPTTSFAGYKSPSVVLANGDLLHADIVIGTDGSTSLVRNAVLSPKDNLGIYQDISVFSTTYTDQQMKSNLDTQQLIDEKVWTSWMGHGETVMGHPVGNQGEYVLHAFWPDRRVLKAIDGPNWTSRCPTQKLAEILNMDNCNPTLQKLIHLPSRISRATYLKLPNVDQWVHSSGTIVIMGEAAHPYLPCSNQSTSVVVEDAAVFGGLFSRIQNWDQIPSLMEAFQDLRKSRSKFIALQDTSNVELTMMGPGPERDARNAAMMQTMNRSVDDLDDKIMLAQWDAISEAFCYNAMDEAANWWASWGMLGEMAKRRVRNQIEISVEVMPSIHTGSEVKVLETDKW